MAVRFLEPLQQIFFECPFSPFTTEPFDDFYAECRRKEMLMVLLTIRDKAVFWC
jgi:hypothetical protein